jgi:hypothetical protein
LDLTTIGADQLTRMLTAGAGGHLPDSAGVALLTAHETWLRRRDFLTACLDTIDDGQTSDPTPMAAIGWARVPGFAATTRASSGELAVLLLAASLAGQDTGSLRDLTSGLGPNTLALVLDAIAHRAGWHETGRHHRTTGRLPAPTPDHLQPAITGLRDLASDTHRRMQALQHLREADPHLVTVTAELTADHPDLAPVTVTVTDYRQVLTNPHTTGEAGDLLATVVKLARHLGVTITLGVDLTADPTALDWLAPLPLARTVQQHVPAAAGWDPHGYRATAHHATAALAHRDPPPRPARPATQARCLPDRPGGAGRAGRAGRAGGADGGAR